MEQLLAPLKMTLTGKMRADPVKQEVEKQSELKRAALRVVVALMKLPDAGEVFGSTLFLSFLRKREGRWGGANSKNLKSILTTCSTGRNILAYVTLVSLWRSTAQTRTAEVWVNKWFSCELGSPVVLKTKKSKLKRSSGFMLLATCIISKFSPIFFSTPLLAPCKIVRVSTCITQLFLLPLQTNIVSWMNSWRQRLTAIMNCHTCFSLWKRMFTPDKNEREGSCSFVSWSWNQLVCCALHCSKKHVSMNCCMGCLGPFPFVRWHLRPPSGDFDQGAVKKRKQNEWEILNAG